MPRPRKFRKVCCMPQFQQFRPDNDVDSEIIVMSVEEYESIRLIDHQGFTQAECAAYMHISRTTVQQIYTDARKKIAISIVDGKTLIIKGGDFILCDGKERFCTCGGCRKHRNQFDSIEKKEE